MRKHQINPNLTNYKDAQIISRRHEYLKTWQRDYYLTQFREQHRSGEEKGHTGTAQRFKSGGAICMVLHSSLLYLDKKLNVFGQKSAGAIAHPAPAVARSMSYAINVGDMVCVYKDKVKRLNWNIERVERLLFGKVVN